MEKKEGTIGDGKGHALGNVDSSEPGAKRDDKSIASTLTCMPIKLQATKSHSV